MSQPAVPRLPIRTRSEWGAVPPHANAGPLGKPTKITVHHPAQGYSYAAQPGVSLADGDRAMRAIQASHHGRGFQDAGYHFTIDGAGVTRQGRSYLTAGSFGPDRTPPGLAKGEHVGKQNTGNIGVCVLGCFGAKGENGCGDTPSGAALTSLTALLAALCAAYDVSPSRIVGHRDLAPTACPGDRLYTKLEGIRQELRLKGL